MTPDNTPPADDEIEVSIFGPGRGEALAVHLGGGRWMTVDSCMEKDSDEHPVLAYFTRIGVDPARQVDFVVGTHAHDDHIAGLTHIVKAATNAKFITSQATLGEEYFANVRAAESLGAGLRRRIQREYDAVYDLLEGRRGATPIVEVQESYPVLNAATLWAGGPPVSVTALSPTHTAVRRVKRNFAQQVAKPNKERKLKVIDPNHTSVALWVQVGDLAFLLGADLPTGPKHLGWKAVDVSHKPAVKASLFKIPHHGSPNAHYARTWSELLQPDPVAVLAPFRHGDVDLPGDRDVSRIVRLAGEAYSTTQAEAPTDEAEVEFTAALMAADPDANVRNPSGRAGHVQARQTLGSGTWQVRMSEPAHRLT